MESYESYQVMEDFIEQIPDDRMRRKFEEIVSRRRPFQQFKYLLFDYPELRQQWVAYKDRQYREYVQDQMNAWNHSHSEE